MAALKFRVADALYAVAHELVHVADAKHLGRLLREHRQRLPRELVSDRRGDISSLVVHRAPGGLYIDRDFWSYLTEYRAFTTMNVLYHELAANQLPEVQLTGREHLQASGRRRENYRAWDHHDLVKADPGAFAGRLPATRGMIVDSLVGRGVPADMIRGLDLPEEFSPISGYIVATYATADPRRSGAVGIYVGAPYFAQYCRLSVDEILSGKLLEVR
jgi:hypothetical protein